MVRKVAFAAVRYSKISIERSTAIARLIYASVLPIAFWAVILSSHSKISIPSIVVSFILLSLYGAVVLDAVFNYHGIGMVELIFGKILNTHHLTLRNQLVELSQEIYQSSLTNDIIKRLAYSVTHAQTAQTDVASLIRSSRHPYIAIRMLGYVKSPTALPLLQHLMNYNNVYSYAAMQAIKIRMARFAEERESIRNILWNIWKDKQYSWKLRKLSRKFLLKIGENPKGHIAIIGHSLMQIISFLFVVIWVGSLVILLSSLFGLMIKSVFPTLPLNGRYIRWPIWHVLAPIFVWFDAKKTWSKTHFRLYTL